MDIRSKKVAELTRYDETELSSKIDYFMFDIGMPRHLKGAKYLTDAIAKVYYSPRAIRNVVEGLYCLVAADNGVSFVQVERNMRTAINNVWENGDAEKIDSYLECSFHSLNAKPTTREFIALVADKLRRGLI